MNRASRGGERGGRGRGGRGGGTAGTHKTAGTGATQRPTPAATPAPEKYVVIISNVENDFAKVHQDRLSTFLCLDPARRGAASLAASHRKSTGSRAPPVCYYDLTCRSETRSAELSVHGEAAAVVGSVFATRRAPQGAGQGSEPHLEREDGNGNGGDCAEGGTGNAAVGDEALCVKESLTGGDGGGGAYAFASLTDMAAVLAERPYFTHPLALHVSLPGHAAGEALAVSPACERRLAGEHHRAARRLTRPTTTTTTAGDEVVGRDTRKRPRAEAEHEDDVRRSSPSSAKKDATRDDPTAVEDGPAAAAAASLVLPKQCSYHQKDLVTAVAAISATQWTARQMREQLRHLPGFLSCWRLYAKHYRVVFQDETTLFRAKQLLDQFQLDGGVRVTLNLSDALSRRNADFIAKEEATVDATTAV